MRDPLFESVVSTLKTRKGHWSAIAKVTGVSTKTMSRLANGEATSPRRDTLIALDEHFNPPPAAAPDSLPAGAP